jgi:serine protease AprX
MQPTTQQGDRRKSVNWGGGSRSVNWGGGGERSVNWGGGGKLVLLAVFLGVFVFAAGTLPGNEASFSNVHPALTALAASEPQATARVIVQSASDGTAVAAAVRDTGGTVVKELEMINATVAELPAAAVAAVAQVDGVNWVSPDGPLQSSAEPAALGTGGCGYDATTGVVASNCYLDTLNVRPLWEMGITGAGVGIAVIDSGISPDGDLPFVAKKMSFSATSTTAVDVYGHGTFVAGIVAGNGHDSGGAFAGVAPGAHLLSLKISDEAGMAYESDTVDALAWVLANKDRYNIRVVNLSVNATTPQSYHTSPLDAAVEILWFNGIVVVASSGNTGPDAATNSINTAPANDPFIITVGATNEANTATRGDDSVAAFTAYGVSDDGFFKPEIMAPGKDIVSVLAKHASWNVDYPERVVGNGEYFRISGTSMAAPMVSGAAALMLQHEPGLNPDQVKYRLLHATNETITWTVTEDLLQTMYAVPYLDVFAAVMDTSTETANTGTPASQLLSTGADPANWSSVNWGSVNWGSVNWGSVNWGSVNWGSVNWGSVSWGS